MENASKALIMAGGVLIAVLIIGLFVYMFTSVSSNYKTEEDIKRVEEISEYNNQFESYNKKLLRGSEVISLMNKAISSNEKYKDIDGYEIEIEFILKDKLDEYKRTVLKNADGTDKRDSKGKLVYEVTTTGRTSLGVGKHNIEDAKVEILGDSEIENAVRNDFKRRVFNCIDVEYHKLTGRIMKMTFEEKKTNLNEGF